MKKSYLLPHSYKRIGWVLLIISLLGACLLISGYNFKFLDTTVFAVSNTGLIGGQETFSFVQNNVSDELISIFFIIGAFCIGFSRQKEEDEFIATIRYESIIWATYLNYAILLLTLIFIYGLNFFQVLVLNMFTTLLFFLIRFNWLMYKSKRLIADEK